MHSALDQIVDHQPGVAARGGDAPHPHPVLAAERRVLHHPHEPGEQVRDPCGVPDPGLELFERVLAADDYILADYRNSTSGREVNFFAAYYDSLTSGGGIHSPEVCIPVGGWEVSQWEAVEVDFRTPSGAPLKVNRAIIQKGTGSIIFYLDDYSRLYWFNPETFERWMGTTDSPLVFSLAVCIAGALTLGQLRSRQPALNVLDLAVVV